MSNIKFHHVTSTSANQNNKSMNKDKDRTDENVLIHLILQYYTHSFYEGRKYLKKQSHKRWLKYKNRKT